MKNASFRKTLWAASFVMAAAYATTAAAHSQSGSVGKSTSGAAATDVYIVNCYNDGNGAPAKLYVRVKDTAPVKAPLVGIQAVKNGFSTSLSQDPVDGDANYSPGVTLAQGAGNYTMSITKAASNVKTAETYVAEFHCQTSGGAHTGTDWYMTQNQ